MINEHAQYFNDDGKEVPSVTTVLKIINKPELLYWANGLGFARKKYQDVLDDSSIIGTYAHKIIEVSTARTPGILPFFILDELERHQQIKVRQCVTNFSKWKRKYKPEFIKSELRLTGENYGGTLDCICKINDKICLVDYKTSKSVYPSMFLQLAAYNLLLKELTDIKIDKVCILRLDKNKNKYDFATMNVKHLESYEKAFLQLYKFFINWGTTVYRDFSQNILGGD